ncbi:hypothetical protein [Prosthecochloris sp. GSB1]|uniref:hypothetical protein n=1 Tax=Prosthecochloris sp. GSB1 TaxID=281093 RepID=UPI001F287C72|nr:hypothetical protein [Prosthecochloris sp. GSB1]
MSESVVAGALFEKNMRRSSATLFWKTRQESCWFFRIRSISSNCVRPIGLKVFSANSTEGSTVDSALLAT